MALDKVLTYVFVPTKELRKDVQGMRKISGVVKADAPSGRPDACAIVEGNNMASIDAVIDRIAVIPRVEGDRL